MATFITVLENDMRSLSSEARRKYPALKDAAERGILKLRATPDAAAIAQSDEVIKTFLLACETKNVKLCAIGLSCLQKLTAHDAVPATSLPQILTTLEQNSELLDESVQLKTLQLILTLLQSNVHPEKENDVSIVLGICFRLLGNSRCADSVHGTAAATLRQAVALTFDRVVAAEGLPRGGSNRGGTRRVSGTIIPGSTVNNQGAHGLQKEFSLPTSSSRRISHVDDHKAAVKELSQPGRLGLKLLEDIVALANGSSAGWLNVPSLSRVFALDMLEYVLSHYVAVFMLLPAYANVLRQKVCSLLMTSLRATGEQEADVGEPPVRRLLLRCVSTVTRFYSTIITTECEVFLQMLIKSMELEQALWNRIYVLDVLRGFCTEARILRTIFEIFDMRPHNTNVVHDMVATLARVVSVIHFPDLNEEVMLAVASMFTSRAKGVEWVIEVDTSGNPLVAAVNEAQAITLAIESLLGAVLTISTLADEAVEEGELESPRVQRPDVEQDESDSGGVEHRALALAGIVVNSGGKGDGPELKVGAGSGLGDMCRRMVDSVWKTLLEALSLVLAKSTNEATILEILRGYQAFTQACGLLRAVEPRDAFLASLCKFTVAQHTNPEGAVDLGRSLVRRGEDGIVLTPKNVQALRTLFNVSHRLADVLGPAWVLVLETLACLDRTLHAPHATTQEVSASVPKQGSSAGLSDFSILSSLESQLFESTAHMSDTAVRALMGALRQVSKGAVSGISTGLGMAASGSNQERGPGGGGAPQGLPRMFAVDRMVDTVLHNLQRVDRLWDELTGHLLELTEHESPAVRAAALDALDRSLTAVLGCEKVKQEAAEGRGREAKRRKSQDAGGTYSPSASKLRPKELSLNTAARPTDEKFEVLVIQPLVRLYGAKDADMRAGALRSLLHVLERHGERLYHSWPVLLKLLGRVATDAERDLVPLGFQSVRVVMNDCLATMPADSLGTCIEVAGAFGAQKADLNISLTAVTLLWTTADFFGKGGQEAVLDMGSPLEARKQSHMGATTSESKQNGRPPSRFGPSLSRASEDGSRRDIGGSPVRKETSSKESLPGAGTPTGRDTPRAAEGSTAWSGGGEEAGHKLDSKNEQLLGDVFLELQALCTDDRPEVRNSGIRTLFASLVSHGSRISGELWRHCVWELLLPLLENVKHLAATSSKEESAGRELGKAGGKTVLMLVHHSRNTAQKQWDETLVMYLNGMSRLLRSYFRLLEAMPDFDKAWSSYLQFVAESIAEGSKEVGIAAVSSIHTVLQAQASKGTLPRPYWESAFDLLEDAARCSVQPESRVALKARVELLESLGALYTKCSAAFEPRDFLRVLAMVDVLVKWPLLPEDSASLPGTLPQVQRTVLDVLPQLRPIGERHVALWPALLQQMVGYLPGGEAVRLPHCRVPQKYRRKRVAQRTDVLETSVTSLVSHELSFEREKVKEAVGTSADGPLQSEEEAGQPTQRSSDGQEAEPDSTFSGWVSSLWGGSSRRLSEEASPKSFPQSPTEAKPQTPVESSPPQQSDKVLETKVPSRDQDEESRDQVLAKPQDTEEQEYPDIAPGALSALFAERVCGVLTELYTGHARKDAQISVLPDVVAALGRCTITRRDAPDSDLWRVAVRSFKQILDSVLGAPETAPDWNIASPPAEAIDSASIQNWSEALQRRLESQTPETLGELGRPRLWKELAELFEEFLLGACGKPQLGGVPADVAKSDEQLEGVALDTLCERVLAHCREAPEEVQRRLVAVIDNCAARTSQLPLGKAVPENCSRFSLACLVRLFVLCGRGGPEDGYDSSAVIGARVALPILIARCDSILKRFAEDESQRGEQPLPQMRLDELVCMLQELARLVLHPQTASVIDIPLGPRKAEGLALRAFTNGTGRSRGGGRTSWKDEEGRQLGWERAHLLLLYTPLCEMVISREPRVQELVLVLFRLLGAELGLVRDIKELPI